MAKIMQPSDQLLTRVGVRAPGAQQLSGPSAIGNIGRRPRDARNEACFRIVAASCPAWNRCFASGYTFPSGATFAHPLIETWNGGTWTTQHPVETPAPHSGDSLQHVSCVSRSHCESVGYSFVPHVSNSDQTLAEMWNGHVWTFSAASLRDLWRNRGDRRGHRVIMRGCVDAR